ncbi:HNH endonuclease domain-containing protein [Methylosinus sp. PW1]|uniref:HNH endonuclease domain-containing protein n=1 Tax=Methylosinus sp. PW1 TaxID=107636 RepID=UPI00056C7E7C|nr:HNH endonuclease domain-containing protein [Methylosinus sp. PW1]
MFLKDIISRSEAKTAGIKRYFTGNRCKHGHISERKVSNGECVDCSRAGTAAWAVKNTEHVREYKIKYRSDKKHEIRAYEAKYRIDNLDNVRIYQAKYFKKYYAYNREKLLNYQDGYRADNGVKVKGYAAIYRATPEGHAIRLKHTSKRRALKRGHEINWTNEDHENVKRLFQEAARLELQTGVKYHVDHIIPLSRGGDHHPSNMQVVTAAYNMTKGSRTEEEMRKRAA